MLQDAPASVKQNFVMVPFLASLPLAAEQAQVVFKAALQVAKMVMQLPPKPKPAKPSASALAKPSSASHQTSSQSGSSKLKNKPLTPALKGFQHSQKLMASSSCKFFFRHCFYKSVHYH